MGASGKRLQYAHRGIGTGTNEQQTRQHESRSATGVEMRGWQGAEPFSKVDGTLYAMGTISMGAGYGDDDPEQCAGADCNDVTYVAAAFTIASR